MLGYFSTCMYHHSIFLATTWSLDAGEKRSFAWVLFCVWLNLECVRVKFPFYFCFCLVCFVTYSTNISDNIQSTIIQLYIALLLLLSYKEQHPKALLDSLPYALCDWINDTVVMDDDTSFNLTCNSNMSSWLYLLPCFRNTIACLSCILFGIIRSNPSTPN